MTEINLSEINQVLGDITKLRSSKQRVSRTEVKSDEYVTIYEEIYTVGKDNIFLKITTTLNSYNEDEVISSIQFVKPTSKTITVYENI